MNHIAHERRRRGETLPPGRCERCLLGEDRCICAEIPSIPTRTRILVVRHRMERWKPSNSVRIAALAMPSLTVHDHGLPDETSRRDLDRSLDDAVRDGAWLLWPEGDPIDGPPIPPPKTIVVLDGSWSQARRMRQRLPVLHGLPRLVLPAAAQRDVQRMRRSPAPGLLSTMEAIARAIGLLESDDAARRIEDLYDRVVTRCVPL
jgi:DTW domain-containing protein YfiP